MKKILACLALLSCTPAFAGPFGLDFGMKVEDFAKRGVKLEQIPGNESDWFYLFHSTPEPNRNFSFFTAVITKRHGLCQLTALTKDIKTDGYGLELQDEFFTMEKVIDSKYGGKKTRNKYYKAGGEVEKYWLMRIHDGDKVPKVIWGDEAGKEYPGGLKSVELEPRSTYGVESGILGITYTSSQWDECKSELREENKKAMGRGL